MKMVIRDLERICDSAVILFFPKSHEKKKVAQNTYKLNSEHLCHRVEWNYAHTNITTRKLEFDLQTDQLNTELHLYNSYPGYFDCTNCCLEPISDAGRGIGLAFPSKGLIWDDTLIKNTMNRFRQISVNFFFSWVLGKNDITALSQSQGAPSS